MRGYVSLTDNGWYQFPLARPVRAAQAPATPGRRARVVEGLNRMIGCIAVTDVVMFTPDEWVRTPADWSPNIVSGRTYDLDPGEGRHLWQACLERAAQRRRAADWVVESLERERTGKPLLIRPRLGQASFRLAVLDAYGQQCAVTHEHSLPVLEAAHIRPWHVGGAHALPNGMPLRRDLHRLFDLGYVTIGPDLRFAVSRRLRDDYANGRSYYALTARRSGYPTIPRRGRTPSFWRGTRRRSSWRDNGGGVSQRVA